MHMEETVEIVMTMESVAANPILMATSVTNVLLVTTTFHLAQVGWRNLSAKHTIHKTFLFL